jgi:hypothetical protein
MWVSNDLTIGVILHFVCWAVEAVFKFLLGFLASFSVRCRNPYTGSRIFVEVKSCSASVFIVFSINALVEEIANGWIWMGEESVLSWAVVIGSLRRFYY